MPLNPAKFFLADVYREGDKMSAGETDKVVMELKRKYGALIITVDNSGQIVLDAVNGLGATLDTVNINTTAAFKELYEPEKGKAKAKGKDEADAAKSPPARGRASKPRRSR